MKGTRDQMSDQTDPTGAGTPAQGGAPTTGGEEDPLTKLQAELTRVGTAERKQGETAGKRALLTELGFSSKEEALGALNGWRAQGTDASELEQKYQAAEARAAQAEARANQLGLQYEASAALVAAGVRADRVEPALQLLITDITKEPERPNAERVQTLVGAFKERIPDFFQGATPPPGTPDPSLTPTIPGPAGLSNGNGPNTSRVGTDPASIADALFEQKFGKELRKNQPPLT